MTETQLALIDPHFDERGNSNYSPCWHGLHLCGAAAWPLDPSDTQPYTALNIPAASSQGALAMFAAAKAVAECAEHEADYCCDLNIGGDHIDDFWTNRQLLPALIAAARL